MTFGGVPATSFIVNSDTSITAIAPPGAAGTVDVIVTTLGGSSIPNAASQYTYISSAPLPPSHFVGIIKKNKFLNITEHILKAKWKPSPSPDVAFYKINKRNQTVAIIPATGPFVFRTEVEKDSTVNYVVIAVSTSGIESTPVPLKLRKNN